MTDKQAEAARLAALELLMELDCRAWETVYALTQAHVSGRIGLAAWQTAVDALLLKIAAQCLSDEMER